MGNIYKVLKQGYPATYNFKDEADGTSGTDIAFVDAAVLYNGACEIVSDWQGHRKVLRMIDDVTAGEDPYIIHNETQATAGTREFWVGTNDVTEEWYFHLYELGHDYIVYLRITASNLYYCDSVDAWQVIQAVANDTPYHIKLVWRADNSFDVYVDGILKVDNQATNNNQVSGVNRFYIRCYGDSTKYFYIDAYGDPDNDANYNVGDNIHWRHYKDQDSDFESEATGTTSTSIGFVDTDNSGGVGTATIIPSFDEHKKILELYHGPLDADDAGVENNFASAQTNGTIEFGIKTSDATKSSYIILYSGGAAKCYFRISSDVFQWHNGVAYQTLATTPLDATWYHIRFDLECAAGVYKGLAADTATIYINNVSQGTYAFSNVADNINKIRIWCDSTATYYTYIDSVSYSWSTGNKIADNRTLEYHSLSKTDITNKCSECHLTKAVTTYATASIETSETFGDEHYLQIIDENSDLRFIGNRFKDIDIGVSMNGYNFQDLNKVELEKENSYTASSAEDVNASLLGVLTNVGQADGRLIYYTEDDPAGDLKPNYRNKPQHMIIRILAIRGGKKCIIKASGRVFLDDNANPDNGVATITGATSELMDPPLIDRSSHQINYVEVRGGIDPDTGTPFSGVSQDAAAQADGTGIIPYYKRLRELQSDTDCLNMAIAIRTGPNFTPQILRVRLRGIYADPGEVINFAYSDKSFTATNCYVDSVRMNVLTNVCNYSLNTGIFDRITLNAPGYTMADETADDIAETLYERVNTKSIPFYPATGTGAAWADKGVQLNGVNEFLNTYLYIGNKVDPTQDVIITFVWDRNDANNDTISGEISIAKYEVSGTDDETIENATGITLEASLANDYGKYIYTLVSSDVSTGYLYEIGFGITEARDITVSLIEVRHHFKK